jgi:TonB family protein
MYLDFEDYRPEFSPVGRGFTPLERICLSVIAHLLMIIAILVVPKYLPDHSAEARERAVLQAQQRAGQAPRFVFVSPRVDRAAPKPPPRAENSDQNRVAQAPERAKTPTNPLPYSRGNSPERVEAQDRQSPRGQGPAPSPAAGQQAQAAPQNQTDGATSAKLPDSPSALQVPATKTAPQNGDSGRSVAAGGALGDALKNLQRYVQREQFDNPSGGAGQPGATIQFDTKGVEFGPWLRRFVAQVKRNWFIPYAAMSMKGHVIITFNVHKSGAITDLQVIGPCPIDAFNNAAFGALVASNPTLPLPPEYPDERAFFTVTFYYNEQPG